MISANDPALTSWVEVPRDSDFPIQNLPFGIFRTEYLPAGAGVAIGTSVLDLVYLHEHGFLDDLELPKGIFNHRFLNGFLALGKKKTSTVRNRISHLLRSDTPELRDNLQAREMALIPMKEVIMQLPVRIPNYTDFYSSKEHATNVGALFRDPKNALLPNWKHLPVAYHGRASSIVVSGTNIHRPHGQIKPSDSEGPVFAPSTKLDFELELAFITCGDTILGTSLSTKKAEDHVFGFVLFNDWSARDIQQWEYIPLGPFLGKNFASTMSSWIVTADALEPFRVSGPVQEPSVLPYLASDGNKNYNIELEVTLQPEGGKSSLISRSNSKHLYWNVNQQLAHHTVNGCNIQTGDLYASGTISGPAPDSYGSLLELTANGATPLLLEGNVKRKFIEDGDTVILRGRCTNGGVALGFGDCSGKILRPLLQ